MYSLFSCLSATAFSYIHLFLTWYDFDTCVHPDQVPCSIVGFSAFPSQFSYSRQKCFAYRRHFQLNSLLCFYVVFRLKYGYYLNRREQLLCKRDYLAYENKGSLRLPPFDQHKHNLPQVQYKHRIRDAA